jgi:hypothetical protein
MKLLKTVSRATRTKKRRFLFLLFLVFPNSVTASQRHLKISVMNRTHCATTRDQPLTTLAVCPSASAHRRANSTSYVRHEVTGANEIQRGLAGPTNNRFFTVSSRPSRSSRNTNSALSLIRGKPNLTEVNRTKIEIPRATHSECYCEIGANLSRFFAPFSTTSHQLAPFRSIFFHLFWTLNCQSKTQKLALPTL